MTTATTEKLTGQNLIDLVTAQMQEGKPRAEICSSAGYLKTLKDGSQGPDFISFYETLLAAKKAANPELFQTESDYPEYDQLTDDQKELYDDLEIGIGRVWTHEETLYFMEEMSDIGVETKDQFDDAFDRYIESSWNAKAEFAEELVTELEHNLSDSLVFHAIDWQSVWDHQLQYDYHSIQFDGATYFFRNI
jgi:putative intracellular protease/amidase